VLEVVDPDAAFLVHRHDAVALVDREHVHHRARVLHLNDVLLGAVLADLEQFALAVLHQPAVLALGEVHDFGVDVERIHQLDFGDLTLIGFNVVDFLLTPVLDPAVLACGHDVRVMELDVVDLANVAGHGPALRVDLHDACFDQDTFP